MPAFILTYHHVADAWSDPGTLSVSPTHFGEHLEVLSRRALLVALGDVTQYSGSERPAVAVTIDDGYADNLLNAKPLLEQHGIPATVFVTSGDGAAESEFWWDELDRLLLFPGTLPKCLVLPVGGGNTCEWDLERWDSYGDSEYDHFASWKVWEDPPTPRQAAYRDLCVLIKTLAHSDQLHLMARLREVTTPHADRQHRHRRLTPDELQLLAAGPLIEIGGHTATHPVLTALPSTQQFDELVRNKRHLEESIQKPVMHFAYPYGAHSPETRGLAQSAGFTLACTTTRGGVGGRTDPMCLPRFHVNDMDGDHFARWFVGLDTDT